MAAFKVQSPPVEAGNASVSSHAEPAAAPRPRVNLPSFETGSTRLRKLVLNLTFVAIVLVLVPVLASQFFHSQVLIEPIAVPQALIKRGLTPEVVASRLWDGLRDVKEVAGTNREALNATAEDEQVQFSVPEVGLSMDSIVRQTRQFFNIYQTRISGEFVCANARCRPQDMRLRLRVIRGTSDVIDMPPVGDQPLRAYFTQAAARVLSVVDPYIAAAAIYQTEPVRGVSLLRRLIRQQHPDAKWAHNFIGLMLQFQGDDRGAIAEFRAALALDPDFTLPRINAGNSLVTLGELQEARIEFDIAARRSPDDVRIVEGYANIALAEGKSEEALALLESANAEDPGNPVYLYKMGDIEQKRGNLDAAKAHYAASLAIDPAFSLALTPMFSLALGDGDLAGGEALLRAASDFVPNDAEILAMHGASLAFLNKSEEALEQFQKALVLDPDNIDVLQQAANMMQTLDRQAEAVPLLDRAIALSPYDPSLLISRGTSLALIGSNAEARRDFQRVLQLDTSGTNYAGMATSFIDILDGLDDAARKQAAGGKVPPTPAEVP